MASTITQPISTVISSVYSFVASWSTYIYQKCWSTQPNVAETRNAERKASQDTEQLSAIVSTSGHTQQLEKDRVDDKARNALQLQHSARPFISGATGGELKQERERLNKALLEINSDPVTPPLTLNTGPKPASLPASDPAQEAKELVKQARDLAAKIEPKFSETESVVLGELERCADLVETEAKPTGNARKLAALKGQLAGKMVALTEEYERALKSQKYVLEHCQSGLEEAYSRLETLSGDSSLRSTGFNPKDVKRRLEILGDEIDFYRGGTISADGRSKLLKKVQDIVDELKKLSKGEASEAAFDDIPSYATGRTRRLATQSGAPWEATIRILPSAWLQIQSGDGNPEQILGILRDDPVIVLKDGTQKGQRVIKPEPYGWIFSTSGNLRLRAKSGQWPPKALYFDDTHRAEH